MFEGKLDKKKETVSFEGEDLSLEDLDDAITWLRSVHRWMRDRRVRHQGGRRWTFKQGDPPRARYMVGTMRCSDVPLLRGRTRKEWICSACKEKIPKGVLFWRQRPGSAAGHSRERFCCRCVETTAAPVPAPRPFLRVLDGGKA